MRSEEDRARRAERERVRRATLKEAGVKVERSPEAKARHAEAERKRRKDPETKVHSREYKRRYREEHREEFRTYNREHQRRRRARLKMLGLPDPHAATPEWQKQYRQKDPVRYAFMKRASTYGVSVDRQKMMLAAQLWRCANLSCRVVLSGRSMQLDHCHATNQVRAFLCGDCNAALGRMGDDPTKIRGLAEYIERF